MPDHSAEELVRRAIEKRVHRHPVRMRLHLTNAEFHAACRWAEAFLEVVADEMLRAGVPAGLVGDVLCRTLDRQLDEEHWLAREALLEQMRAERMAEPPAPIAVDRLGGGTDE